MFIRLEIMGMDIIEKIYPTGRISGSNYIFTPQNIVEDMINMLPDDFWTPDKKILDIYTKSGRFLKEAFKRLYNSPYLADMDIAKRKRHILTEQLFGLTDDFTCLLLSERMLYGYAQYGKKHIKMIKNMIPFVQSQDHKFINNLLEKEFDTMKFDLVIGNPPYNKGMDLDFVDLAYKLSKQYVCMITPAKWQTAEANQKVSSKNINYGQFRQMYVPHMKYVCFYPDCKDVFNIMQADGISWYLIDKLHTYDKCTIVNKLNANKVIDSVSERNLCDSNTLFNAGDEIIKYIGKYNNFTFPDCDYGRFRVFTNNHAPGGALYAFSPTASSIHIIGKSYLLDTHTKRLAFGETSLPDDAVAVYASDDLSECQSFISWLKTKFVRFFVAVNISKLAPMMCNECFKLVPAPPSGKFDHIYTDEELYKAFNLPQKYIDVIEAVVKERK